VSDLLGDGLTLSSGSLRTALGNGLGIDGSGQVEVPSGAIDNTELASDSVTVAGNTVSLGGATGIAHGDLSNIGASDHHTRPSAGRGLTEDANSFDVAYTGAKAYLGTDQILSGESADTDIVVAFDTEAFDTGGNYDTSTFAFTAPSSGFYAVATQVMLVVKANEDRVLKLQKDTGSGFSDVPGARARTYESDDDATVTPSLTTDLQLNSGDSVRVVVRFLNALDTAREFIRAESNLTIRRVGG
jgi:hypothetical protein